jgi:cell division protein FtsL
MAWQSARYADQERELERLETVQEDWVESNKRLIAVIAVLSSPERIEHVARTDLRLSKIAPEAVLQIRIEGRGRNDG